MFQTYSENHKVYLRHKYDLHRPPANLSVQQEGVYYSGWNYIQQASPQN